MTLLRLIVKVPEHCQTGPETWQDTTHYRTFDVECPEALAFEMRADGENPWRAVIVGAELLPEPEA